jgi:7-cyano-7-deazaguanine synthase in queuosine biosynthesis
MDKEFAGKFAILSLSGGMDSSTLLLHLLEKGYSVIALSFDYGQKHKLELEKAKQLVEYIIFESNTNIKTALIRAKKNGWGLEHHLIKLEGLQPLLNSNLVEGGEEVPEGHYEQENMVDTVVPNRNKIFASIAQAVALSIANKYKTTCSIALGIHAGDHCIPSNELITTSTGKKTMFELEIGDEVLSFNQESQQISFQTVINKINNGFRDDILRINTTGGRSLATTSNHKFFKVRRHSFHQHTGWQKEIVEEEAKNLLKGDWVITPCSDKSLLIPQTNIPIDLLKYCDLQHPQLKHDNTFIWFKENNKVKRFVSIESFIKLIAWFISEGNRGSSKQSLKSNSYRVGIPQSISENPEYCKEIQEVIKDWGFNITACEEKNNENNKTFYFSGPTTKVFELCGNNSFEKKIPEEFMFLHPQLLFDTLIKGDGSINEENYFYGYVTASSLLKEQICFLGTALGYSVGYDVNEKGCFNIRFGKNFRKNMNRIGEVKIVEIKSIEKEHSQEVWDITIEDNHNFFAGMGAGLLVSNSIYPDCRKEFRDADFEAFQIGNWNSEKVETYTPYLEMNKYDILVDGQKCCNELGLDFNEIYRRTNTSYKPVGFISSHQEDGEVVYFSDYKSASSVERIEAFIKLGIPDPVQYADETGLVLWETAKIHVEKVLSSFSK